jgi:CDP-diacylglycerol--serine O-phosphatidyltransferase|tara:strand:+ start:2648 stop:3475 length:828 start_codon:yes stop_codon:yes gene_type:complete
MKVIYKPHLNGYDQTMSKAKKLVQKSIYLVPNFFTSLTLFFGFLSLANSQTGSIYIAAICIYVAMITDLMDGLIARLTNTQTVFGQEYDSLADMLAFGVAPASLVWHYALRVSPTDSLLWLMTFLYVMAITARLARFNAMQQYADTQYFRGLPSPAAGGFVCSVVIFCHRYSPEYTVTLFLNILLLLTSICVVSNMCYPSLKNNDFIQRRPILISLLLSTCLLLSVADPLVVLVTLFSTYVLAGPVVSFFRVYFRFSLKKMAIARWGKVLNHLRR